MTLPFFELGTALIVAFITYRVITVYTSPLSNIPNAGFGAAFSRLAWAFPQEYNGTITLSLPDLHERLGPLIRISPNEVSFYCRDTYETVHKVGSKFKKDPRVYGEFVQGGHPALFSLTDPAEHAKRRRIMAQLFSRSKVPKLERLISHHVQRFIHKIRNGDSILDLGVASRALEADIMSDFSFGTSINAIDSWAGEKQLSMVEKNDEKATWMPVLTSFPLLCEFWEKIEQGLYNFTGFRTQYSQGLIDFHNWARTSWQAALSANSQSENLGTNSPNLIQTLCNAGLPAETALSEAGENLGPGTDTTSATLAHIIWALAHNPTYQEALYQDLASVSFATDMTTLESIPRLQACVKEGIRWAGAAAAMLPRTVPAGGIEFHGSFIPEGTVLTSSPIWYLHDKNAYPSPKLFNPYRWLSQDGSSFTQDSLRDRFYIPFSRGSNICLGAHFSHLELYVSVSQFVRNFRFEPRNLSQPIVDNATWNLVPLPPRKEWVAAVLVDSLQITIYERE